MPRPAVPLVAQPVYSALGPGHSSVGCAQSTGSGCSIQRMPEHLAQGCVIRSHLVVAYRRAEQGELVAGAHVLAGGRLILRGRAGGPIRVDRGGHIAVYGRLDATLVVAEGGTAVLDGRIDGLISNAGSIRVSGVFSGQVLGNTGLIEVAAGAVVNRAGRFLRLGRDGTLRTCRGLHAADDGEAVRWLTYRPGCRFVPAA